jgi:hypothetical protein
MNRSLDYARDTAGMNLFKDSLLRQVGKERERPSVLERIFSFKKNDWHEEGEETAIGFEASWAGVFPRQK